MKPQDPFTDRSFLDQETLRRNGAPVKTPVWFVQQAKKLNVRTIANSWKVKFIRNTSHISAGSCKSEGEPIGNWQGSRGREVQGTIN